MKSSSTEILLQLIRLSLDDNYQFNQSVFESVDWLKVINKAIEQGVLGLTFDSLEKLSPNVRPDIDSIMEWAGQVNYQEQQFEDHKKIIVGLAKFYDSQSIKMMLLKGYGLSKYWPVPNHRPVGDIDIYLGHLWKFGDQLVEEKLGVKVEDGHEHHTTFTIDDVLVENHYDFINTKAHRDATKIEDRLKELASQSIALSSNNECSIPNIYYPSADFNVIFLIRHLGQHFAGERVTLRQLLDWGLFLQHEYNNIYWESTIPFLKQMKIWTFFNQIDAICVNILGINLPTCLYKDENKDLESRIFNDIIDPEFAEDKPHGLFPVLIYKLKRWWHNRWKHPLVYDEWLLPMFLTGLWSHLRRIKTIKD